MLCDEEMVEKTADGLELEVVGEAVFRRVRIEECGSGPLKEKEEVTVPFVWS